MVPHELKIERIRLGVPQYRLAAALGITPTALCAWENGRRPITPEQEHEVRETLRDLAASAFRQPAERTHVAA